jgi:Ni,Fe-hydrogenase I cytochrome b subunit
MIENKGFETFISQPFIPFKSVYFGYFFLSASHQLKAIINQNDLEMRHWLFFFKKKHKKKVFLDLAKKKVFLDLAKKKVNWQVSNRQRCLKQCFANFFGPRITSLGVIT